MRFRHHLRADAADPPSRAGPQLSLRRRAKRSRGICAGAAVVLESTTYPGTTHEVMKPILEGRGLRMRQATSSWPFRPSAKIPAIRTSATADDPEGGRRRRRDRVRAAIAASLRPRSSSRWSRSPRRRGRGRQAHGEHLPRGQHRARQRAEGDLRRHGHRRLGGDRRGEDQALRLHAVLSGPGLGGHCIPIDPFYLTWKAREFEMPTRFIELAGEINPPCRAMSWTVWPELLIGSWGFRSAPRAFCLSALAYKKNVADMRESPSLKLIEMMEGTWRDGRLP